MDLPKLALSVRQPWAWAIIYAGKDIENRSWQAVNHGLRQRGRIAIHAAKGMTRDEYEDTVARLRVSQYKTTRAKEPRARTLAHHAADDSAPHQVFCIRATNATANEKINTFVPAVGQLGYFEWKEADASIVPEPAAWMLPPKVKPEKVIVPVQPAALPLFDN